MHAYQSYSVSLCLCLGAKTLHNINNLGLCIREHVYNILFQLLRLDMSHGMRKSVFRVKDQVRHKMDYTAIEAR